MDPDFWDDVKRKVLLAKINTYLGGLLLLSFGLFILIVGFQVEHMVNPLSEMIAAQEGISSSD